MLNIRELQKRWLHYKIKSYLPSAVIITTLLIITAIVYTLFTVKNKEIPDTVDTKQIKESQNISQKKQKIVRKITQTPVINNHNQSTSLTLKPSLSFMDNIKSEEQQPYNILNKSSTSPQNKIIKKRNKVVQNAKIEEEYIDIEQKRQKKTTNPQVSQKKNIITIERRNTQKDIKEIIARFKKNNNPALSLFIAQKYYELGNYEQAYNYTLITNEINNDIEDSWLIFAKSLVKLHKREMAIKTLTKYINYSHSGNARILLNDIKLGKFK